MTNKEPVVLETVSEELLPCPFCGGEGHYQTDTEEEEFSEEWIGCLECGATTAIEVWNRRSPVLARLAIQAPDGWQGMEIAPSVAKLDWSRPPYLEDIQRADTIFGIYRVWSHDPSGVWFWNFDGYERTSGEADTEVEATACAQSHFDWCVLSSLAAPNLGATK